MRLATLSNIAATWVGVVAGIFGGYVALDNYQDDVRKRVDERQRQTFALVGTYMSKDLVPIRDKVRRYVRARQKCDATPFQSFDLSETEITTYIEFFDVVEACLAAGLCHPGSVERFFVPTASEEWPVLQELVMAIRKGDPAGGAMASFGAGLERLVRSPAPAPKC